MSHADPIADEPADASRGGPLLGALRCWGRGDGAGARRALVQTAHRARHAGDAPLAEAAEAGWALLTGRFARALRSAAGALASAEPAPELRWLLELGRASLWRVGGMSERALAHVETLADPHGYDGEPLLVALLALERGTLRGWLADRDAGAAALDAARAAFRALALPRFESIALRRRAALALAAGAHAASIAALEESVALAEASADVQQVAAGRADLAVAQLLAGDAVGAAATARAARSAALTLSPAEGPPGDGALLRAFWALAEAGCAGEAQAALAASSCAGARAATGLPLADHSALLLRAEIARRTGDATSFAALARSAWELASQCALRASDPLLGARISVEPAREALRAGVAVDHTEARLAEIAPAAFDAILLELLRDRGVERRLRALAAIARRGGRGFEAAVAAAAGDANPRVAAAARSLLPRLDAERDSRLRVRSLGRLEVRRDGELVPERAWRGAVTRRLFCRLLAAEGRPVSRAELCEDLWPEVEPVAARNHLRVALSRLRAALDPGRPPASPSQLVRASGDSLQLDLERVESWDAREFERLARDGAQAERQGEPSRAIACYREALALYAGDPLPEQRDEDWALSLRARFSARFRETGGRLGELLLAAGDLDAAGDTAARLLRDDPADEDAAALRMRIHLARGEPALALRVFEEARSALARILAAEPGPVLRALAEQARS